MNISNYRRKMIIFSVACLLLFLFSGALSPSVITKSAALTSNSLSSSNALGYSPASAFSSPATPSGSCPAPVNAKTSANIPLASGAEPTGISYDSKNGNMYVATNQGYFEAISTSTNKIVGGKVPVDQELGAIAADSKSGQVFVASKTQSEVYVFNPVEAKGIALPSNSIPTYMLYDPVNDRIYVSDTFAGKVSEITPSSSGITNIGLSGSNPQPWGMSYDTYNGYVFVADRSDNSIQVISGGSAIRTISLAVANSEPTGVAFDPFNNVLYVTGEGTDTLYGLNVTGNDVKNYGGGFHSSLPSGSSPLGIGVDCSTGNVWIALSGTSELFVLSTCQRTVIAGVTSGISVPNWFAFDPTHHWMYVTNTGTDSVEAISSDSLKTTTAVDCPIGLADYGTDGNVPAHYTTTEFVSSTTITSLNIEASSVSSYDGFMGIQLNAVVYGVSEGASSSGVYWVQNVIRMVQIGGSKFGMEAINNIWNWAKVGASVPNDIHFNQTGSCTVAKISPNADGAFYYCEDGNVYNGKYIASVSLPFTVVLNTTVYTATSGSFKGDSSVAFSYKILQGSTVKSSKEYDIVSFNSKAKSSPEFDVGGNAPNKLPSDVENVFTGFGGLAEVTIDKIAATMQIQYLSGKSLVLVQHAYSNGGETGETVQGVHMVQGSGNTAKAETGTDDEVQLW
jgi:DNA-binding beta-propeller fold protein YncE